ncbi:MAG: hypothetical protein M3016_04140 [Actinomycetota bacterium]|nr:hypothetical protein [Actinomycetota bacterium]
MSTALPDAQGTVHESGSRAQTLCQAFQATVARAPDAAGSKANELGLEPGDQARMVANPRIREHIDEAVARANDQLSRVEQIKRYTLLDDEWLPGGDELTPTMKLKRKPIAEKYAGQIEDLYAAGQPG